MGTLPLPSTEATTANPVQVSQANTVSSCSTLPQPLSVLGALNLTQAPGNVEAFLSMHVPQAVKKNWLANT